MYAEARTPAAAPDSVVQAGRQVLQQLDGAERGDRASQAVTCAGTAGEAGGTSRTAGEAWGSG